MKANDETTRRRFLEGSAGAGAGHVASSLLTARSFAAVVGANDRVQIGVIGTGGRALQLKAKRLRKWNEDVLHALVDAVAALNAGVAAATAREGFRLADASLVEECGVLRSPDGSGGR